MGVRYAKAIDLSNGIDGDNNGVGFNPADGATKESESLPETKVDDSLLPINDQELPPSLMDLARAQYLLLARRYDEESKHTIYFDKDTKREVLREDSQSSKIYVCEQPTDNDILIMLIAAKEKYGEHFKVFGSDEFIERCAKIAMVNDINIQEKNEQKRMKP
jgi:hypothetical protein